MTVPVSDSRLMAILSLYSQSVFLLLIILLDIKVLSLKSTTSSSNGNVTDHHSLLAFKSMISHDPHGALISWNDSSHFCNWEGITCGHQHNRVTILDIGSKGLEGSLSPHVGNLSFLRILRLDNNSLGGIIPPEFGHLFRLQRLNLNINYLQGEIPANLSHCSNLTYLGLATNKLLGNIPNELSSLLKLTDLIIHENSLGGEIPSFIGNLSSLETISAAGNFYTGNIPNSFGQLKNLKALGFGGNDLSGTLVSSIYNLSSINILSFPNNKLYGSLSLDLGSMLPQLQFLQLGGNQFSGPLPYSLSNASKLERLDLTNNSFTGKIAINFGNMPNLVGILLWHNQLGSGEPDEMNFIASLANCSNFEALGLFGNQLRGVLPPYAGNFSTKFYYLVVSENQLYGDIPSWVGNLYNMSLLAMRNNELTGSIPANFGNLQKLQRLALNSNSLSGEIPSSIGNLSLLNELYLHNNKIEGNIPSSLGNCKNLAWLTLYQNNLSGTIPKELLQISSLSISLNLAQNHLSGSLPPEVGNLRNLVEFDVSENELSGEIPSTLGSCTSLENLYLERNYFQGPIPSSLSSLRGLRNFDLSRNNLSGQIPKYLEDFSLRNLNLSFNDLEGEVPTKGVFTNVSEISLVGNTRLCGGISELRLPKCIITESKKHKMPIAAIVVISAASAFAVITMATVLKLCWFKKKRQDTSSKSLWTKSATRVSYKNLLKATDGFSSENLIGKGSFGTVYKGILDQDGKIVAVKVLNIENPRAFNSFMAECKTLRNIRHRNLVKVITSCSSVDHQGNDFKALVFEFMPNGSLERWLHEFKRLSYLQRLNISIDVACALDYLHHNSQTPIIHCDLKPSNILLDSDMIAHVGDFGLAKFLPELANPSTTSSVGIRGTIGYAAPEYGLGSEVSRSGDIYSYGILLLEMITGKRPTDPMFEEGLNLHNFARKALPDIAMEIVDPTLLDNDEDLAAQTNYFSSKGNSGNKKEDCLISMIKIGVACSVETPQDRMDIRNVVHELILIRDMYQGNQTDS